MVEDEVFLFSEGGGRGVERRGLKLASGASVARRSQARALFIYLFYLFSFFCLQMSKMRTTSVPELGEGDWLRGQRTAGPETEKTRR